jgi:hypothetical protein
MSDFDATWAAKERALKDRIRAGGFAVALSGGGHRATLATLGALLAIVDRGLSAKVIQIASVSGGSITNAFVAQRCKFETLRPGELDGIATELATAIVRKGVLSTKWMALLLLSPVVFGLAAAMLFSVSVVPWTWLAIAIGLGTGLFVLLAGGLAIEWLLDRRYFRQGTSGHRLTPRAQLASLSGGDVDHVFCMTDLALGLPVYASSGCGGMIWRRLKVEPSNLDLHKRPPFQTFDAGQLSIAELVRASAAFPGIPPRRLSIPSDPDNEMVSRSPKVAFLADGGLWNNLATHVIREDGFIGTYSNKVKGIPRPYYDGLHSDIPLLCFNGSAPLQPSHPWVFSVPGVALLKSLLQTANILNANTVLPRVAAMHLAFQRRAWQGEQPGKLDPVNLVVDLTGVQKTAHHHSYGFWRDLSPEVNRAYDSPIIGRAKLEDRDSLVNSTAWMQAIREEDERVDAPTTLDRIDVNLARRIISRAYLNTYFVSLFLAPLSDGELDRLIDFEFRLDQILGLRDKSEVKPSRDLSASGRKNAAEQLVVTSDRGSLSQNDQASSRRVLMDAEAQEAMEVLAEREWSAHSSPGKMRHIEGAAASGRSEMEPVMNEQQGTLAVGNRKRPWLEVTNFAIDCRFIESVESAANPEELKTIISSKDDDDDDHDHFYNLCVLWDESRPASQRPDFVPEARYKREYWERVYGMVPTLFVALDIVRDVLSFHGILYNPNSGKFSGPDDSALLPANFRPQFMIFEQMFDYPDFEPFRYAYCIISRAMQTFSTLDRATDGGELSYSIGFKVIPEAEVPEGGGSINLSQYLKRSAA